MEGAISKEFDSGWTLSRHDHFIRGLHKAPADRTEVEISAMFEELAVVPNQSNPFLNRFEATGQLMELCRIIQLETYEHNKTVFEQGDPGDSFFIIYSGAVSVYVKTQSDSVQATQDVKVAEYRAGQSFGDLSLLYAQPRAATVITNEPTALIVLHKEPFDSVVKNLQEQQIKNAYEIMSCTQLLEGIQEDVVMHLARTSFLKRFTIGQTIASQDTQPAGIFVIKKGIVRLTRQIEFRAAISGTIEELAKQPTELEARQTKEVVIDELSVGLTFCDFSVMHNKPLQYSAVCVMPCYSYFIDRKTMSTLKADVFWDIQRQSKPYPNDVALRKLFFENHRWQLYKRKLVQDVTFEKKIKKQGFNTLRDSFNIPKRIGKLHKFLLPPLKPSKPNSRLNTTR